MVVFRTFYNFQLRLCITMNIKMLVSPTLSNYMREYLVGTELGAAGKELGMLRGGAQNNGFIWQ